MQEKIRRTKRQRQRRTQYRAKIRRNEHNKAFLAEEHEKANRAFSEVVSRFTERLSEIVSKSDPLFTK